jgi:tellurite methyltransferase
MKIIFLGSLMVLFSAFAEEEPEGPIQDSASRSRTTKLMAVTGDADFGDERTAWDKTYARKDYVFGKDPSPFLIENSEKIPKGKVLDIAVGEGRHAVYLAKRGYQVEGVDISVQGLRKAKKLAAENGVTIQTVNADLNRYKIRPNTYSGIVNFFYLQRNLFPQIKLGLKKGGVIVFQAHTVDQMKIATATALEKEYLLEPGELKKTFSDFEILHYSETNDGKNALASLVARKK